MNNFTFISQFLMTSSEFSSSFGSVHGVMECCEILAHVHHNQKSRFMHRFTYIDINTYINLSIMADFLGRTEVPVATIKKELESKGPVTRRLLLHEVPTGEVWVHLDLQLYGNK